jgi:dolichol-phosphate mannosyltransferase
MTLHRTRLTIIAPVFNEEEVIAQFHQEVAAVMYALQDRYWGVLLFVVDRSTDRTLPILRDIASRDPRVQVLVLSSRFGHQMSLLAGIDHSPDADLIVMMDSDLQHPPPLIPQLLELAEAGNDIVYTVRRDSHDAGRARKMAGRLFYRLLSYMSRVPIIENAADFRLISGRVAAVVRQEIRERKLFLRGIFSWVGFSQARVEYVAARRAAGRSKYPMSRMLALAAAAILSFSTRPLQIGIFVGLGFAALSMVLAIYTVIEYFVDSTLPSGWTTIVTLLLLFSGVQLIVLGVLGVYIGGIYDEVKARPHYIVDETINLSGHRAPVSRAASQVS